jgi:hypothetical protein
MQLNESFPQSYIDSLPQAFEEDLAQDNASVIDRDTYEEICAKLRLIGRGVRLFVPINPANYSPNAAKILLTILNTVNEKFSYSDLEAILQSSILQLYYRGYEPDMDPAFDRIIWPELVSAPYEPDDRRRLVVKMHKAMNPGPPPRVNFKPRGGKKSKKRKNRQSRKH